MAQVCGNPGCDRAGDLICSKCRNASYCGRDCQVAHWPTHKGPCKLAVAAANTGALTTVGSSNSDPSTVYLGLNEIKTKHPEEWAILLQEIFNVTTISVTFLGAREETEGCMDYKSLFGLLKILFPPMTQLNVCLIGPEVSGTPDRQIIAGINVRKVNGLFHSVYGQLPVHFQKPSVAVLLCPGFNADKYKNNWHPSIKLLLDNNTLSLASGYSSNKKWTADGAIDDYLLEARYVGRSFSINTFCQYTPLIHPYLYKPTRSHSPNHTHPINTHSANHCTQDEIYCGDVSKNPLLQECLFPGVPRKSCWRTTACGRLVFINTFMTHPIIND